MQDIFCAKCQKITAHKGSVDANGEFLFECQNPDDAGTPCGRFVKFPADTTKEQFDQLLVAHEEANAGQVSMEAQEARLAEIISTDTSEVEAIIDTPPTTDTSDTTQETQA